MFLGCYELWMLRFWMLRILDATVLDVLIVSLREQRAQLSPFFADVRAVWLTNAIY